MYYVSHCIYHQLSLRKKGLFPSCCCLLTLYILYIHIYLHHLNLPCITVLKCLFFLNWHAYTCCWMQKNGPKCRKPWVRCTEFLRWRKTAFCTIFELRRNTHPCLCIRFFLCCRKMNICFALIYVLLIDSFVLLLFICIVDKTSRHLMPLSRSLTKHTNYLIGRYIFCRFHERWGLYPFVLIFFQSFSFCFVFCFQCFEFGNEKYR